MLKFKHVAIISAVIILLVAQFPIALGVDTKVSVSAPDEVKPGDVFSAYIMIEDVTDFDAGQFDLSFDSDVIAVVDDEVKNGEIGSQEVPILVWNFKPGSTNLIRVIYDLPGADGVSGSGYLAKIIFEVTGDDGDTNSIEISNGLLGNKNAAEIPATWTGDEVKVDASATPQPTASQDASYQGSSGYEFNETETSGGAMTAASEKITRTIPSLPAGTKTSVVFSDMDLSMITLDADQDLSNIELSIQSVGLPANIPDPDATSYACFEIELEGLDGAGVTATIDFGVARSWIDEHNIDKATITLNRYHNGEWQMLPTFMAGENNHFVNYEAESAGFSYFAITGEGLAKSESADTEGTSSSTPAATLQTGMNTDLTGGTTITWGVIIAAIFATAIVCAVVFLLLSRRK